MRLLAHRHVVKFPSYADQDLPCVLHVPIALKFRRKLLTRLMQFIATLRELETRSPSFLSSLAPHTRMLSRASAAMTSAASTTMSAPARLDRMSETMAAMISCASAVIACCLAEPRNHHIIAAVPVGADTNSIWTMVADRGSKANV